MWGDGARMMMVCNSPRRRRGFHSTRSLAWITAYRARLAWYGGPRGCSSWSSFGSPFARYLPRCYPAQPAASAASTSSAAPRRASAACTSSTCNDSARHVSVTNDMTGAWGVRCRPVVRCRPCRRLAMLQWPRADVDDGRPAACSTIPVPVPQMLPGTAGQRDSGCGCGCGYPVIHAKGQSACHMMVSMSHDRLHVT